MVRKKMKSSYKKKMTTNGKITYRYPPRYNEVVRGTKIPNDGADESKQSLAAKKGLDGAKRILSTYYNEKRSRKKR